MLLNVYLYQGVIKGNWHATGVEWAINAYSPDRDRAISDLLRNRGGLDSHLAVSISDDYRKWLEDCEVLQAWEEEFDCSSFDKILFRVIQT